jgi:hypothetical protein
MADPTTPDLTRQQASRLVDKLQAELSDDEDSPF